MRKAKKIRNPAWTPEENAVLKECSGVMPFAEIVKEVQKLNSDRHKWKRTASATKAQMQRLGLTMRPLYDRHSMNELSELLGVSADRVERWCKHKGLKYKRVSARRNAISMDDLKRWARKNLNLLVGIEYERLVWVLDSPRLARRCCELQTINGQNGIPIRRKDTGERFLSIRQAARAIGVDHNTISYALKHSGVCVGVPIEREVAR